MFKHGKFKADAHSPQLNWQLTKEGVLHYQAVAIIKYKYKSGTVCVQNVSL